MTDVFRTLILFLVLAYTNLNGDNATECNSSLDITINNTGLRSADYLIASIQQLQASTIHNVKPV